MADYDPLAGGGWGDDVEEEAAETNADARQAAKEAIEAAAPRPTGHVGDNLGHPPYSQSGPFGHASDPAYPSRKRPWEEAHGRSAHDDGNPAKHAALNAAAVAPEHAGRGLHRVVPAWMKEQARAEQPQDAPSGGSLLGAAPQGSFLGAPPAADVDDPYRLQPRGSDAGPGWGDHPAPPPPSAPGRSLLGRAPPVSAPPATSAAPSASATSSLVDDFLGAGPPSRGGAPAGMDGWGMAPSSGQAAPQPSSHRRPPPPLAKDKDGHPIIRISGDATSAAAFRAVVFPLSSKMDPKNVFEDVVHPPDGEFRTASRVPLDTISTWWPERDERKQFWLYPASDDDRDEYKAIVKELVERNRAVIISAGDGVHLFHLIPPTKDMLGKKVVPVQHKTHLTMVYGKETKRK
jgi:hypothetical protein